MSTAVILAFCLAQKTFNFLKEPSNDHSCTVLIPVVQQVYTKRL